MTLRSKGEKVTAGQREEAVQELAVFRRWIKDHVFKTTPQDSAETIMLLPLGRAGPNYRDTLPKSSSAPPTVADLTAYDPVLFASMIGYPQIVVPSKPSSRSKKYMVHMH